MHFSVTIPFMTIILAYLIGSIPFGLLVHGIWESEEKGRAISFGKSNISPLALWQLEKKKRAILISILDGAKPLLAFSATLIITHQLSWASAAALIAAIAHIFPIFLKFRKHESILPLIGLTWAYGFMLGIFMTGVYGGLRVYKGEKFKIPTIALCASAPVLALFTGASYLQLIFLLLGSTGTLILYRNLILGRSS